MRAIMILTGTHMLENGTISHAVHALLSLID
jgi:hypothetical protein